MSQENKRGTSEVFSASVMRGDIWSGSDVKEKQQKNKGTKQENSKGSKESKEQLDKYSVWGDQNLLEQKQ